MIYVILILVNIIIACMAIYGYKKWRHEKNRKEYYKTAYHEAKDEWAAQSNAVREKGIECGIVEKACMGWKEKYQKAEKELKELKKRLEDARITI